MTHTRPRYETWWAKTLQALFVGALGSLITYYWVIPVQQQRQDDRLENLERQVRENTPILHTLVSQHMVMIKQQEVTDKKMEELSNRLDDHDRRTRKAHR